MDESGNCPICVGTYTFPKILHCGHTFCFGCLQEYFGEIASQHQELKCPLCRATCKIKVSELTQLITNYFTTSSKPEKICIKCKIRENGSYCPNCNTNMCTRYIETHGHSVSSSIEVERSEQRYSAPPSILLQRKLKSVYLCKTKTHFVVETPPDDKGWHDIYSMRTSKSGHIFVVARGYFVLKYDEVGQIIDKILTPGQCRDIVEIDDGNILGIYPSEQLIMKYVNCDWIHFAFCYDFIPICLVEISNQDIAVCGPSTFKNSRCTQTNGHLKVFSTTGRLVRSFYKISEKTKFPYKITCNIKKKVVAIADRDNNSAILLQENGSITGIYTGGINRPNLPFPILGFLNSFCPLGLCCAVDGGFLIPTPDDCLHILDYSGTIRGIALVDCEDGFGKKRVARYVWTNMV